MSKKVSRKRLIEAARKNGFIHVRGAWFRNRAHRLYGDSTGGTESYPITEACFMGQMAINLEVDNNSLLNALNEKYDNLGQDIMHWNDSERLSYSKILGLVESRINSTNKPITLNLKSATYVAKRKDE